MTPAGGAGQNIFFENGVDGTNGLTSETPNGGAGASLQAILDVHAINGQAKFIQNVNDVINGVNGTLDQNRNQVGWLNENNTVFVAKTNATRLGFPIARRNARQHYTDLS